MSDRVMEKPGTEFVLERLWAAVRGWFSAPHRKAAFLAAFFGGLACHMYVCCNMLPNHDWQHNFYATQNWISYGRWFLQYTCEISEISKKKSLEPKNFVVRITDETLLERTGGIVQGMSGSPIIQDGKLIGAVTHVLVNDPTQGYGIFIENMLDAAA